MFYIPKYQIQLFSHESCPSHTLCRPTLWSQPKFVWHYSFWSSFWGQQIKQCLREADFCCQAVQAHQDSWGCICACRLRAGHPLVCPTWPAPLTRFMNLSQENDNFFKIPRGWKKIGQCSVIVGGWEIPFNSTLSDSNNHCYQWYWVSLISIPFVKETACFYLLPLLNKDPCTTL